MHNTTRCITQACQRLGLEYRYIDANESFIIVENKLYFQLNRTPFNSESMAGLCKDKEHQYDCLKDVVSIPKTIGFLDYDCHQNFRQYLRCETQEQVIAEIEHNFSYPVVIKPNKGALGFNVFCCHHAEQVKQALNSIFDKQSISYDYVALAQQYIKVKQEVRVICFDGEPVLCYERVFGQAEFGARYWETSEGKALALDTDGIAARVAKEFAPALSLPGLRFIGLDIVMDENDDLHLIELNSGPQVNHFIANNGEAPIVDMYEKILRQCF